MDNVNNMFKQIFCFENEGYYEEELKCLKLIDFIQGIGDEREIYRRNISHTYKYNI